jgi:hypothetical protein
MQRRALCAHRSACRAQSKRRVFAVWACTFVAFSVAAASPEGGGARKIQPKPPLSFERSMLAGALARAAAQCVMYPADVMKTLAQVCMRVARSTQPSIRMPGCARSAGTDNDRRPTPQARTRGAVLSIWTIGPAKLINGAFTTSLLALPAGALQLGIFPLAKRTGRAVAPPWVSVTSIEFAAGGFRACMPAASCHGRAHERVHQRCTRSCR